MSLIFPKKEILYAPMLGTLGGGSARGFGRGGGGGMTPPELDAPLGMFNKSSSNNEVWFFDVDHETQYSLGSIPYSADGFAFDTMTNICWAETTNSPIYGFIPTGSKTGTASDWYRIQGSNISLSAQNGRFGQTMNNRHWNFAAEGSTLGINIATGNIQANGTGWNRTNNGSASSAYYSGGNSLEDFTLYGDLGFNHGYAWGTAYQLSRTSFSATNISAPYNNDWSSTFYDNRLGVTYVWPQSTTSITAYANSYSAGNFNQSSTTVVRSNQFSSNYSNQSYGIYFFPTKGSGNGWGPNLAVHTNDRGGVVRSWNTGATEIANYGASVGDGCKCSPIFSYENEAYYIFGTYGVLKYPYTGDGTVGTPSVISYTQNVRGWRGPAVTSGQMAIWEFDKAKWDY